jgi:flagellar hook protein FlgE
MSFYTALTGLNGSQADIAATSNNIANVGTTGFKRSRAEFGDIFATSPLQNSSSSIGSGSILKGVKQQFTQGNIAASLNALDLAISGQGFFALKPSLTSSQVVYTRNGSFNVDNNRNVVDSTGQFLLTYPVNEDGSVTSKTINDAVPLQLPVTSGEPKATSNIDLSLNLPADAPVITDNPKFADGYQFSTSDPESFTNSTSLTIFDDLGNPTIATVYFIKTQAATADDPTNKYDTRLVIDETVINPDLVASVNDNNEQIYVDRFGNETTVANIPDDNYFSEGKGAPLYRKDDLNEKVPSQPAMLRGSPSGFDFGEEGNKLIQITNDPLMFNSTAEQGDNTESSIFWGKDFLLVNVDDGDVPVSIDLRPGFYNATQLAAEVERAINDAYGDDKKLQVRSNVDDKLTVDFFRLNSADGSMTPLSATTAGAIEIDLLTPSYVTAIANQPDGIDTTGSSPDFTREEFLAHAQVKIIEEMNDYVINPVNDTLTGNSLGVESSLFTRSSGTQMTEIFEGTDVISFDYAYMEDTNDDGALENFSKEQHLLYSYYGAQPELSVFDNKTAVNGAIGYSAANNTLSIVMADVANFSEGEVVKLAGDFTANSSYLNGRSLTILSIDEDTNTLTINTTGEGFPGEDFTMTAGAGFATASILSDESDDVEAFFEGADLVPAGAVNSYNNKKIVLRETSSSQHAYLHDDAALRLIDPTNGAIVVDGNGDEVVVEVFSGFTADQLAIDPDDAAAKLDTMLGLGFEDAIDGNTFVNKTVWVDEKNPPIKINYDSVNQRFQFGVNHTQMGPAGANFRAFKVYGASDAEGVNNLGIPPSGSSSQVDINSTAVVNADPFVTDGGEMQINAKRFGASVSYNSDTKTFTFKSGTTGETITADGALGVDEDQNASNIQVGRYRINPDDGSVIDDSFDTALRYMGNGDNSLMGVGISQADTIFQEARGLASLAASAVGAPATEPLNEIFNLSSSGNANVFNVSVNGISGIIQVPAGNYVGSTLAAELQTRINQISDTETGAVVGGVTVKYQADTNNFVFTTGTTGDQSTIKVKGAAKLGLDDVPLGVGSIPTIVNLVQATDDAGVPLYVNAAGEIVETPPDNIVTDYYPLYIDEGELTFDKTGQIISPLNRVRYEQQAAGFSISLDVDYSASTQLSQPFSVNNLEQDGFTSGRLDGLDIDATGLLRANYTNGENRPLGKIVLANFNNQNGLKQVGNATFVETATSGSPTFGEAGAEGFGAIQSGSLERSNVDITEELVNLITAQRNFQASSKAIETSTQLTQAIINIRS